MLKLVLFIFSILLGSCALQTKNILKSGSYSLNSGRSGAAVWNSSLTFERYSFYREMSLELDIKITKFDLQNDFYAWLSEDDKNNLKQCRNTYLVFLYDNFGHLFKNSEVVKELSASGNNVVMLKGYISNLRLHPAYKQDSLNLYSVYGICNNSNNDSLLKLDVPGFQPLIISKKELE